jgi:hypothetical protein
MTNRVCARISVCLLVAVAVLALAPTVSFGANSKPVLPPTSRPFGKTYAEWSVLWWQGFLPLTNAQFNACTIGQGPSNVRFLYGGMMNGLPLVCGPQTVQSHTFFFPVGNVECSNLEGAPFHGDTAAARDNCAFNFFTQLSTGTVTLDGDLLDNLLPNYPTKSPDFAFTVGSDNVFGINCTSGSCPGQSTGYGYYLMLSLPPGTHTIHIKASDYGVDTTWTLTVQ